MSSPSTSPGNAASWSSNSEFEPTPPRPFPSRPSPQRNTQRPQPPQPPQPPRLSSPNIFRDFLNAMSDTASRRQATLPHPNQNYRETGRDVNRAIQSANRALQNAQEAFQARRTRIDSEPNRQTVDLTGSPPNHSSEANFISRTTHPHDSSSNQRSRRLNSLDEPVYGSRPNLPLIDPSTDPLALVRLWPIRHQNGRQLPPLPPEQAGQQEQEAINRQRENHSSWERTQARNRQRLQPRQSTMSPPSTSTSSSSRTTQSRRQPPTPQEDPAIESVDLTAVDDNASLTAALAKQRQDAILAQNPGTENGRTPLTAYKCPVCMDTPINATSTTCGHVFCHRCIIDTLNWSMEQRREDAGRKVKGVCPVCRKQLDTKDVPGNGRSLVPLELKLLVKKRKREDVGKGKGKMVKAETLSDDEEGEKENSRKGKARKRESTEDAIWGQFMED